jgi:pyruvate ferredoxin oxidoreductase delta subunit
MAEKPKFPTWREMAVGCVIPAVPVGQGNPKFKTASFRTYRPVTDTTKCTLDKLCWLYCPDSARSPNPDTYFEVDLDYCKGCGICARVCPSKAIEMVHELEFVE